MEISQYIRDLLFTHDRVILSNFGAFIAKYCPATIDEKNNTMTPPRKDIVFDPTITKDGGLLRNYMIKHEKISNADAEKQIMEYVKTIKSKLNAGKKVKFVELGTFEKDKHNKLIFTYMPSENLLPDSYGMAAIELPEESSKSIVKAEHIAPDDKKKSKKRFRVLWILLIILGILLLSGTAIYIFKPQWVKQGREYVAGWFNKNADTAEDHSDKNNSKKEADFDNNKSDENQNKKENDELDNTLVPESTDSSRGNDKPSRKHKNSDDTNDANPNILVKSPRRGYSYLVIGSLPTAEAAEEQRLELKNKGIDADIIIGGTGKYRLSVGEFKDFREANRYFNEFHYKYNIDTWLWEY